MDWLASDACGAGLDEGGVMADKNMKPAAYMHPDGRVVPAATMDAARADGGAMLSSLSGPETVNSGAGFGAMCSIRAYRHFAVFGTLCE